LTAAALILGAGLVLPTPGEGGSRPTSGRTSARPHASDPAAGSAAPEISAADWLNTEPIMLGALRGKVVVIDFLASWSPSSRAAVPYVARLRRRYGDRGGGDDGRSVVFLGLTSEPVRTVEGFVKRHGIVRAVGAGSESARAYGVTALPHAVVVDRAGNIAWSGHPLLGLTPAIERVVSQGRGDAARKDDERARGKRPTAVGPPARAPVPAPFRRRPRPAPPSRMTPVGPTPPSRKAPEVADVAAAARGMNAFAFDLYAALRGRKGNVAASPYGVSTALAVVYAGAKGATAGGMEEALHFSLGQEILHPAMAKIASDLSPHKRRDRDYEFISANRLWGQTGHRFLPAFLLHAATYHRAGVEAVDFARDADAVRLRVNSWVERQTHSKVRDLLQPGSVDNRTRLVLTNAICFKGKWASQFKRDETRDAPFILGLGGAGLDRPAQQRVTVPMMRA
jgi:thiol-disulfide isomerase/thioredoxin